MTHLINGKELKDCSTEDLRKEWDAGMWLDCQEGLTENQRIRLSAVEAELFLRPNVEDIE